MQKINNYILEKLHINKDTKVQFPILLEAKNTYLYEQWENKYEYVKTSEVEFNRLFVISKNDASKIINETNKICYCMYDWPIEFKDNEELENAFNSKKLRKIDLNIYQEYIDKGKL